MPIRHDGRLKTKTLSKLICQSDFNWVGDFTTRLSVHLQHWSYIFKWYTIHFTCADEKQTVNTKRKYEGTQNRALRLQWVEFRLSLRNYFCLKTCWSDWMTVIWMGNTIRHRYNAIHQDMANMTRYCPVSVPRGRATWHRLCVEKLIAL